MRLRILSLSRLERRDDQDPDNRLEDSSMADKKAKKSKKSADRKSAAKKPMKKMMKKPAKKAAKRKPNAAFMKPMNPSATLAAVVGSSPMPRTEVTSKLWGYIKKNNPQDKPNPHISTANHNLREAFTPTPLHSI